MKKLLLLSVLATIISSNVSFSQSVGFSYFFPKNGYFGNPIAPVSLSLPVSLGNYLRISPGISMSNIGGMSLSGLPEEYNSKRALIGPFQDLSLSLEPSIVIPTKNVEVELLGGIFGFTSFNTRLKKGNFDEMIMETHDYDMMNSSYEIDPKAFGWGWVFGVQLDFRLQGEIWGFIAGRYYLGQQEIPISGDISYLKDGIVSTNNFSFENAAMNYQGFEITIGGGLKKKK
ncbi:MAG: hypothetical protein WEA99_01020 [Brumimicrobium sp.]